MRASSSNSKPLKPGSPDHQRLVQLSQLLGTALEEDRKSREPRPISYSSLSNSDMIERLEALLKMAKEVRESPRVVGIGNSTVRNEHIEANSLSREVPPTAAPAPEPVVCPYCRKSQTDCDAMREQRLDVWQIAHYSDPAEIERRDLEHQQRIDATRAGWALAGGGAFLCASNLPRLRRCGAEGFLSDESH